MMCSRCKDVKPKEEWTYHPGAFHGNGGWMHDCGWMTKVPKKVV